MLRNNDTEDVRLFESFWHEVTQMLLRIGRNKFGLQDHDIEDLVQDVATAFLQRVRTTPSEALANPYDLYRWSSAVFTNRCIDRVRKLRTAGRHKLDVAKPILTFDDTALEHDISNDLIDAIESLPRRQREVMKGFLKGQCTSDTAAELGISEASVRSLKRYGTMLLRERLGRDP
ncbi:RNA polymerase sigma factor [Lacipirellula sp.]|uniref:RNA polymerase sigma factor n=1 Tax=Lacipirellula sp. TaxID=2691419 RepID=UPI003D09FE9A